MTDATQEQADLARADWVQATEVPDERSAEERLRQYRETALIAIKQYEDRIAELESLLTGAAGTTLETTVEERANLHGGWPYGFANKLARDVDTLIAKLAGAENEITLCRVRADMAIAEAKTAFDKLATPYMRLRDLLTPADAAQPLTQEECEAAIKQAIAERDKWKVACKAWEAQSLEDAAERDLLLKQARDKSEQYVAERTAHEATLAERDARLPHPSGGEVT